MSWILIILFILVGLVLIALEIVAVPGVTVVGVGGLVMLVFGIWGTYATYGATAGHLVLAGSLFLGILVLVFFLRSKTWKKVGLDDKIDSKVNVIDENKIMVGEKGETLSRLAPAGKALINGETVEVHTYSEFVDEGRNIEVIKIDGNRIMVKEF